MTKKYSALLTYLFLAALLWTLIIFGTGGWDNFISYFVTFYLFYMLIFLTLAGLIIVIYISSK